MALYKLDIYYVRNIHKQSIIPAKGFNFFYGDNASGKSSLIEAIYLLGRAKSFRTAHIKSVIAFEQNELIVSAQVSHDNSSSFPLGLRTDGKNIEIRINQRTSQNRSDLAYALPLQIIHPKSFELLDAGAQIRREFLDWGIFNHEPNFLQIWRKYKKALAHRNALLKSKSISQLYAWNNELANCGTIVNQYRVQYLEKLKPILNNSISRFLTIQDIETKIIAGWDETKPLEHLLITDLERDLRYGFTHSGPHRGDFQVIVNGRQARDVVSRGQLKLLVICLKLAQVELIVKEHENFGCILMDDFSAELDKNNLQKVLNYLSEIECQVFATCTEKQGFGDLSEINDYKMFHMEHGKIQIINVPCGTSL